MISLAEDCLVFRTSAGEGVPYSAEMISVELMGDAASMLDPDFIKEAAAAVFHYFRNDLGRDSVTVAEFSEALERVLRGFNLRSEEAAAIETTSPQTAHSDLYRLVTECGKGCELFFFPRLRDELRAQLEKSPQMLCFRGLRRCVKQLAGARRWSIRCQNLQDQIVDFLRTTLCRENSGGCCALVVR